MDWSRVGTAGTSGRGSAHRSRGATAALSDRMSSSSSSERGRRRWGRARLPIALATVVVLAALVPAEARQAVADPLTLTVEGAALGDVATSDLQLTPAFSPTTTDYVLRCRPGANTVAITLSGTDGASIRIGALSGPRVSSTVQLVRSEERRVGKEGRR